MNLKPGMIADHIDGNGLNNQKANLRNCTHQENNFNKAPYSRNKIGLKGVSYVSNGKRRKRWQAQIKCGKTKKGLGYFHTPGEAALVYNEAAKKYHGEFAYLNKV